MFATIFNLGPITKRQIPNKFLLSNRLKLGAWNSERVLGRAIPCPRHCSRKNYFDLISRFLTFFSSIWGLALGTLILSMPLSNSASARSSTTSGKTTARFM